MIINKNIYFAHIPRTGGVFIRNSLVSSGHDVQNHNFNNHYDGKSVPHLTYPKYLKYLNYLSLKKFSVVREPIDRFNSMIKKTWFFNEEKINRMFRTQEDFDQTINNEILNNTTNWFVPQVDFISHDTKLWKFENKFDNEFKNWMRDNFNINITKDGHLEVGYEWTSFDLTNKQKDYIKNYYYKDYKLLDY
tara:strand:+ start:54 stop:626 length:573 start_codon:yes stop_codon:yes gene_type:complete